MLARKNRVKKKKEFELTFKKGMSFKSRSFILKKIKNDLAISRFAAIISQKVSKKAVERNKIRRRIYSIIKNNISIFEAGHDFIFLVLPSAKKLDFSNLKNEILRLFKKNV